MTQSVDTNEKLKFDTLGHDWWETQGNFRPLHDINPVRIGYIDKCAGIRGKTVIDVGCGGGILAEGMARSGARVTGIDISDVSLDCARAHSRQEGLAIAYELSSPEEFADKNKHRFDVVTCMELLEHVAHPHIVISACAGLVKPGGHLFFSTINRTPKAYLLAILGAEHVLKLLPAGTHRYARFIRPSELTTWCRQSGLEVQDITGVVYIPYLQRAFLSDDTGVNYLLHALLPGN